MSAVAFLNSDGLEERPGRYSLIVPSVGVSGATVICRSRRKCTEGAVFDRESS